MSWPERVAIRSILNECRGLVAWGGDFKTPDEAHFQLAVKPGDKRLAKLAESLAWAAAGTKWGQEGFGAAFGFPLMLVLGVAAMFWVLNYWISRLLRVRGRRFWLIAALITLTPTVLFLIEPQWWRAISWL
jgi:hypothetical protein